LGALAHDVFTRPQGKWARNPILLAITPILTGVAGTCFTRMLPYGFVSVLLTVASAVVIVEVLKSPVAPAISAGLLPLTLGLHLAGFSSSRRWASDRWRRPAARLVQQLR
jgi:hypothetical protein